MRHRHIPFRPHLSNLAPLWDRIRRLRTTENADPLKLPYRDDLKFVLNGYRSKRWRLWLQWIPFAVLALLMIGYVITIAPQPVITKILALPIALFMLFGLTFVFPILVERSIDAMTLVQTERNHVESYVRHLIDKRYDRYTLDDIEHAAQVNQNNLPTTMTLPNALMVGLVGMLAVWNGLAQQNWITLAFWIGAGMTFIAYLLNVEQSNANTVIIEGISAYRTYYCPEETHEAPPAAPPPTADEVLRGLAQLLTLHTQAAPLLVSHPDPIPHTPPSNEHKPDGEE